MKLSILPSPRYFVLSGRTFFGSWGGTRASFAPPPNPGLRVWLLTTTRTCWSLPQSNVRVYSRYEHSFQRASSVWYTMSPGGGGGIWQVIVSPGICKEQKACFATSCRHFRRRSEVKGFKHRHFGIRREFIDHKRPIKALKPLALSFVRFECQFVTCFMQFYWAEILVWWTGGGHLTIIIGTQVGHLPPKIARWDGHLTIFHLTAGDARG